MFLERFQEGSFVLNEKVRHDACLRCGKVAGAGKCLADQEAGATSVLVGLAPHPCPRRQPHGQMTEPRLRLVLLDRAFLPAILVQLFAAFAVSSSASPEPGCETADPFPSSRTANWTE